MHLAQYCLIITYLFLTSYGYSQTDHQIARTLLDQYQTALGSKSSECIASVFHVDAQILPEGKTIVIGKNNIKTHFKNLEQIDFEETFEIKEILPEGDYLIIQTQNEGSWKNPESSKSGLFFVKEQMILTQGEKGNWKIYRYAYNGNSPPEKAKNKIIDGDFVHSVLVWLKNPENVEERKKFEWTMENFRKNSDYMISTHLGVPAEINRPVIDNTFSYCFIVSQFSRQDHELYQEEPAHKKFLQETKDLWEKILISDSENIW